MHVNQEICVGSLLSSLPKSRPVTEQITELFEKSNMAGQENLCLYLQDGAPQWMWMLVYKPWNNPH